MMILYILRGLAYIKIAEKLSIENGWLGFIPYADNYLLGKLAEEQENRANVEKKRPWSKILLWCGIIGLLLSTVVSTIAGVLSIIPVIGWFLAALLAGITVIAALVLSIPGYFGQYRLLQLMDKENATWMLILSILVSPAFTVLLAVFGFSDKYPKFDPDAPIEGTVEDLPNDCEEPVEIPTKVTEE